MKKSMNLAGAFVGVIVGAGFGSGQEILQFFTNFGIYSIPAIFLATLLFAFIGMQIAQLGSHIQSTSHKQIIHLICGRTLGSIIDFILSFFLFGVGVIMIAGAGSIVEQQFGISSLIGTVTMTVLTIVTLLLNVEKIISIISSITPFLLIIMMIVAGYSIFSNGITLTEIQKFSSIEDAIHSNWLMGALLYVSFNIAVGFSMLSVIGGTVRSKKEAALGGILGGVLLGILLLLINVGMLADLENVQGNELPTLYLANNISPVFGIVLSIILLAMIYNTCVGMLYSFTVRFVCADSPSFKKSVILFGIIAFFASFAGFSALVSTVYPIMGYVGFVLLAAVTISWFRSVHHSEQVLKEISSAETIEIAS